MAAPNSQWGLFWPKFPQPGAQKWSLFASKNVAGALQIAIFPCRLLLRKMRPDPGPAGGRESYAHLGWHTHSTRVADEIQHARGCIRPHAATAILAVPALPSVLAHAAAAAVLALAALPPVLADAAAAAILALAAPPPVRT